jgi:hypothetical protein
VKLSYGAGTAIRDFTYDDEAPWPAAADGTGATLVLKTLTHCRTTPPGKLARQQQPRRHPWGR